MDRRAFVGGRTNNLHVPRTIAPKPFPANIRLAAKGPGERRDANWLPVDITLLVVLPIAVFPVGYLAWYVAVGLTLQYVQTLLLTPLLLAPSAVAVFLYSCLISWRRRRARRPDVEYVVQRDFLVCPGCRYDLSSLTNAGVCPECGASYTAEELVGSWRWMYQTDLRRRERARRTQPTRTDDGP